MAGGRCGSCGQRRADGRRATSSERRTHVDPTRALFAAATPRYEVVPYSGASTSKTFSTLQAAQDYARRTGGVLRTV